MEWWLWLVLSGLFGIIVVGFAILLVRGQLARLQMAVTTADEHRKSADRLRARAERVQSQLQAESERIQRQRGTIR